MGRGISPGRMVSASLRLWVGRSLDLVNPVRDPCLVVAAVLTFLEEVGQRDSWWLVAAIALGNLLAVRLTIWLASLTGLGCLRLLLFLRDRKPAGAAAVQGGRAMEPYIFTFRGVTFRVTYGYPSRYHVYYSVEAARNEERSLGWVRYGALTLAGASIECLEFYDNPRWLRSALTMVGASGCQEDGSVSSSRLPGDSLAIALEGEMADLLACWMAADYRDRFHAIVALLELGCAEPPAEYRLLWYWELCKEAGVNPCEEPTPAELAAAFRLVEAHASFDVREQAARVRRQAKLMRHARERGRWNAWVSEHLAEKKRIATFKADLLRQGGEQVTFATSWYDVQTTYEPVLLDDQGAIGYLETFGDRMVAYIPEVFAERWYAERWYAERGAERALHILNCMLRSGGNWLEDDDYAAWVFAREGEKALLDLARAGAPVKVPWNLVSTVAIASKFYRVPVSVVIGDEHYVGYGIPGIHRERWPREDGPLQGELWEQVVRLHGWVWQGEEASGEWPCQADIAAHQLEVRRMYAGPSALFG